MKKSKEKSSALICGSFDPITKGHLDIIKRASAVFDKIHLVAFINPSKKYLFDKEEKLLFMKAACQDLENVLCDFDEGMVCDYLKKHNIDCIVKGIRNEGDLKYEKEMAEYNKKHSERDTLFLLASDGLCSCSSTLVREALDMGLSIEDLLPANIASLVKERYEKKRK